MMEEAKRRQARKIRELLETPCSHMSDEELSAYVRKQLGVQNPLDRLGYGQPDA